MKFRSFLLILATVSIVLLSIAAVSFYWVLANSPLSLQTGGVVANPTATAFIPKQAPLVTSLLVDLDRLESYRQLLAPPGQRRRSRRELNQLKANLLVNAGVDYYRDLQPWLGDQATFAVTALDFDRNRDNGTQPGYLLAVTTKDPELAREFLQLYYSRQAVSGASDLVFEQYKGVNLIYRRPLATQETANALTSAVVGDFVLFANHPKVLRDAINNAQVSTLNLQASPAYQSAIQTITAPRIGEVFVNLPVVASWLADKPVPKTLENPQTLTVGLSVNPQGLRAETALLGFAQATPNRQPLLSQPVGALQYIPAQSVLAIAGLDLDRLWASVTATVGSESPITQLLEQLRSSWQARLGIDLPQDIFSWVRSEYALSLLPKAESEGGNWVFVAQKTPFGQPEESTQAELKTDLDAMRATSSATPADVAIERLDGYARDGGLSVGRLPLAEQTVTAWTELQAASNPQNQRDRALRLDAKVRGVHGSVDDYEVFATSLEAIAQAFADGKDSLRASVAFNEAIAPLPSENDGYLYIDWRNSQSLLEQQFPLLRVLELAGKPLFDHLRSLTLCSHGSQNGVLQATVFLKLGAAK